MKSILRSVKTHIVRLLASLSALLFLYPAEARCQVNSRVDSLQKRLSAEKTDTGKVMLNYQIAYELQFYDIASSKEYAQNAYDEAVRINFKKGIGRSMIQLGNIEQTMGNYSGSEELNFQALEILEKIDDKAGVAICYNNLGILAHNRSDFAKALGLYKKSLQINNSIDRKTGSATSLFCIGTVYENLAKYDSALIFYLEAQTVSQITGDTRLMGIAKTCLANVYFLMGNYAKSDEYNEEAIDLYMKTGNMFGLLKVYRSLGLSSENLHNNTKAEWYYREALKIARQLKSPGDIANNLFSIGQLFENRRVADSAYSNYKKAYNIYSSEGNLENKALSLIALARIDNTRKNHSIAIRQLEEALQIAKDINSPSVLTGAYQELAMTYAGIQDYQAAFHFLERFSDVKDSVMTVEKQEQILELQTRYETEKKEQENLLLRKDQKLLQITRNSLIIGALLLTIIIIVIFRSLSIKKRDNMVLKEQKEEIMHQKEIVEDQKASITDSIRYAKRIQSAMLPPDDTLLNGNQDSFVLYLPRDIVSGDFFWVRELNEDRLLVCAADCTGHGVPGAFMSMLGMSLLNDIVNTNSEKIADKTITTGNVLNQMRSRIKSSLRQTGREGETRDGMDMSLCLIETDTRRLSYSGANNPVYFVSEGILNEIKATRNPIGIYLNEMDFETHEVELPRNSVLYMFSDGYSDQIGVDGRKFLSKNFKLLLSQVSHLSMNEIRELLHKRHLEWRKDEEQVDDILVLGLRI